MSPKITEKQKDLAIEGLKEFGTLVAAAKKASTTPQTLQTEMKRSPLFRTRIEEATAIGRHHIGDSAMQVIESFAFDKNVDTKIRLTAAMSLCNAFVSGFRGTSRIEGHIDHDFKIMTAIPRPGYAQLTEPLKSLDKPKDIIELQPIKIKKKVAARAK